MPNNKQTEKFSKEDILECIKAYSEECQDIYSIEESWWDCYKEFHEKRNIKKERVLSEEESDDLCLHLGFYLASWGMFRNSFLANKYYTIHKDAIGVLLEDEYDVLWDISAEDLEKHVELLEKLTVEIKKRYKKCIETDKKHKNVTDLMVTKILLGTMGCVPAYDDYLTTAIKNYGISRKVFNQESVKKLAEFYKVHKDDFEMARKEIGEKYSDYPPMKLLDMCFWKAGQKIMKEKKNK